MSFDPERYAAGLRRCNDRERARIEGRRLEALAEASRLAAALRSSDPTIGRVILFGSVAKGQPSREDFDIDLALDGGDLYAALDITEASRFKVDLVSLALLPEGMRKSVLDQGRVLAE
jgi:predicted nucleotidyltransferase